MLDDLRSLRPALLARHQAGGDTAHERRLGLEPVAGFLSAALVASVEKGSPAEKAGLKSGDVIRKVDGKPVTAEDVVIEPKPMFSILSAAMSATGP